MQLGCEAKETVAAAVKESSEYQSKLEAARVKARWRQDRYLASSMARFRLVPGGSSYSRASSRLSATFVEGTGLASTTQLHRSCKYPTEWMKSTS